MEHTKEFSIAEILSKYSESEQRARLKFAIYQLREQHSIRFSMHYIDSQTQEKVSHRQAYDDVENQSHLKLDISEMINEINKDLHSRDAFIREFFIKNLNYNKTQRFLYRLFIQLPKFISNEREWIYSASPKNEYLPDNPDSKNARIAKIFYNNKYKIYALLFLLSASISVASFFFPLTPILVLGISSIIAYTFQPETNYEDKLYARLKTASILGISVATISLAILFPAFGLGIAALGIGSISVLSNWQTIQENKTLTGMMFMTLIALPICMNFAPILSSIQPHISQIASFINNLLPGSWLSVFGVAISGLGLTISSYLRAEKGRNLPELTSIPEPLEIDVDKFRPSAKPVSINYDNTQTMAPEASNDARSFRP